MMFRITLWSCVLVAALLSVGCSYDNGDKVRLDENTGDADTSYGSIDTDVEMENLESGVGLFVTYESGGSWTIQFGCDTADSGLDCRWDVYAYTSNGGRIYSYEELDFEEDDYAAVSTDGLARLQPITTSDLDGIKLRIDEGEPLTLDVWLEGEPSPNDFVFWMNDGEVVPGAETTVIELSPTKP